MKANELAGYMIQLEDNARILYLRFSEVCNPALKDTMIALSMEEERHQQMIADIFREIKEDVNVDHMEIAKLIEKQQQFYNKMEENIAGVGDKDFFIFALGIEKDSINIYSEILEKVKSNYQQYLVFQNLIDEERKHTLFILDRLYER